MKKGIAILALLLNLLLFNIASASVQINEIMYDLDGADVDWVEVYNPDAEAIDLTSLKLLISNSTSNHGIESSSSTSVGGGEYAVIVPTSSLSSFNSKWFGVGKVFTASFSLPNEGGKIEINNGDKNQPLSSVSYATSQGAAGGKSLQKINGAWAPAVPTPGLANQNDSNNQNTNTPTPPDSNTSTDNTSSASQSSKKIEVPKRQVKIIAKNLAFTGMPLEFKIESRDASDNRLIYGKYFWNFGDGDSKEEGANYASKFTHTYFYPGEYTVLLEYYLNDYPEIPEASHKMSIKVVPLTVSISSVGSAEDFFIELSNNTDYEIDISKWSLASLTKNFTLPKNTILSPKKKIILSPKVTGISLDDGQTLKLISSSGELVFDYGASTFQAPSIPILAQVVPVARAKKISEPEAVSSEGFFTPETFSSFSLSSELGPNLTAAAGGVVGENNEAKKVSTYVFVVGFVIFVSAAAAGVYFLRKKKEAGDEFEILD